MLELNTNRAENRFSRARLPAFIASGKDLWRSGRVTWQGTVAPADLSSVGTPLRKNLQTVRLKLRNVGICVKIGDSIIQFGCYEVRKGANHRTGFGSAERTGIPTNHNVIRRNILYTKEGGFYPQFLSIGVFRHAQTYSSSGR